MIEATLGMLDGIAASLRRTPQKPPPSNPADE